MSGSTNREHHNEHSNEHYNEHYGLSNLADVPLLPAQREGLERMRRYPEGSLFAVCVSGTVASDSHSHCHWLMARRRSGHPQLDSSL